MSDRDLERFGEGLARHRAVRPSDEFRRRLRADLMAAPVVFAPPAPRFAFVRFAAVAASILLVLTAGAGSAAASSLPGEPAFGLKRAYEEIQLLLAADEPARAEVALAIAERRLADLQTTAGRPELAPAAAAAYAEALTRAASLTDKLRAAAPSAKRDKAIDRVTESTRTQEEVLEELSERLPEPAQPGIERAREAQHKVTDKDKKDKDRQRSGDDRDDEGEEAATPRPRILATPRPRTAPSARP
ncbi:MAG TPA: DUF5667 domain-containing protein [Candidatus Limnocylindria bacterium]|nr:DUF5667 domain-containing protein [Candidatus Limnocylindria bacterium]